MSAKYIGLILIPPLVLFPGLIGLCDERREEAVQSSEKRTLEDVIPLTMGNIRGHKMLYNEGYSVVISSRKAFDFAREKSIVSSREAIKQVEEQYRSHSSDYKEELKGDLKGAVETGKKLVVSGTERSGKILSGAKALTQTELAYAKEGFLEAWDSFVKGNISIARRTEAERKELTGLPGSYFMDLRNDFSNIWEIAGEINGRFAGKIENSWEKAFKKAGQEFKFEYERSGGESNSITALGHILYGYLKAFYHGVAAPSSKTIVKTGVTGATDAVFLPVAAVTSVAGRTVQSTGLAFYYVGKAGVKIVSPTVEGGVLSSMAILSLASAPVTYVGGITMGAVNQVAFTAAGPVVGASEAAVVTTADTAKYVGFLAYDGVKGTTKVVINQTQSGVVLGYHALTAVPAHLVMGAVDSAVFLAYDGPRLVVAVARGELKKGNSAYSAGDLPVGTVVDLKKLEGVQGMEVKVLSDDPAVIRDVLQKLPCDLREEGAICE